MAFHLGDTLDTTFLVLDDAGTPVLGLTPTTIIARDPKNQPITFTYEEIGNGVYRGTSDQPASEYGMHYLHIAANDEDGQVFQAGWDVDPPETVIVANQMAQQVVRPVLADSDGTFDSRYLRKDGPIPAVKVMDVLETVEELPLVGEPGQGYVVANTFYVWGSGNDWVDVGPWTGKSAYEVAVDEGFVGSEGDWLQSLRGDEGPPGPPLIPAGEVLTEAQLPDEGVAPGEVYVVTATGHAHGWSGAGWVDLGAYRGPKGDPGELTLAQADAIYYRASVVDGMVAASVAGINARTPAWPLVSGGTISPITHGAGLRRDAMTGASMSANQVRTALLYLPERRTFSRVGLTVTTGDGNVRMGIASYDFASRTATLLLDAGERDISTSGSHSIPIDIELGPGWVMLLAHFDAAPAITAGEPATGYGMNSSGNPVATPVRTGLAYGPFPPTITFNVDATTMLLMWLEVA